MDSLAGIRVASPHTRSRNGANGKGLPILVDNIPQASGKELKAVTQVEYARFDEGMLCTRWGTWGRHLVSNSS